MRASFAVAGVILAFIGIIMTAHIVRVARHSRIIGLGVLLIGIILLIFGLFTHTKQRKDS